MSEELNNEEAVEATEETPVEATEEAGEKSKVVAGILGILLGGLGIHKFYLGYTKEGIIQIVITVCTCGFVGWLGLIEGIIYLVKSDEEFEETYVKNQKGWF